MCEYVTKIRQPTEVIRVCNFTKKNRKAIGGYPGKIELCNVARAEI